MTKFVVRLVGEDSARTFETPGESETIEGAAQQLVDRGYLLGKMKTRASARAPRGGDPRLAGEMDYPRSCQVGDVGPLRGEQCDMQSSRALSDLT